MLMPSEGRAPRSPPAHMTAEVSSLTKRYSDTPAELDAVTINLRGIKAIRADQLPERLD